MYKRQDLINAQNALDDLHDNWGSDLAQAKLDLLNAQEMLDKMDRQREIMNYQRCSSERIEDYETLRDLAEELYQRIPSGYTPVSYTHLNLKCVACDGLARSDQAECGKVTSYGGCDACKLRTA